MPELPEVETVVRQLHPKLHGAQIHSVRVLDAKLALPPRATRKLHGRVIAAVERAGKQIALRLELPAPGAPPLVMLIHLRMTGRLIFSADLIPAETKYVRTIFELNNGWLVFQDTRRFGTITLLDAIPPIPGLDPLSPAFTTAAFGVLLCGAPTPIKPWLLRQDKLPGMGNIYASESLFLAGIHPARPAGSLRADEIEKLRRAIQSVLRKSIRAGGTTFSDFRDGHGRQGNYAKRLSVYDRAGDPCPRCAAPLQRMVQAQRSTFFCTRCQK